MNIYDFIPPIAIKVKNHLIEKTRQLRDQKARQPRELRACHLNGLFITHSGDVYPCCDVWTRKGMKIGNINDNDLELKISGFNKSCHCERYILDPALGKKPNYDFFNIEFGLTCQGKCAMCCVDAPEWTEKYDLYEALSRLVAWGQPKWLSVQGGEVLIQKKTLAWLETEKERKPDLKIDLVTNGNVSSDIIPYVESVFNTVTVSMVGFQPETYRKIMGMEINKTMAFVQELVRNRRVLLTAKFLITPLNLHEANLFLEWVAMIGPHKCAFQDSDTKHYINLHTRDAYWRKVVSRTGEDVRKVIIPTTIHSKIND